MEYIPAKQILSRNRSTAWFGTDYTMNLYRGCCHGCIYCDSRSACYGIEDFGRVRAKENALALLRDELRRKVRPGIVGMGSMSAPSTPFGGEPQLPRHALELLDAYGFGAAIATKGDGITRDIDVLRCMREHVPVLCKVTVTTTDAALAARVEPNAPSPARRLEAVARLAEAGLFAGVLLMPVLPFLEDNVENLRAVVEAAAEAGARFVYPAFGMTLRDQQREYYYQALEKGFPGLAERYRRQYGPRYECPSPRAKALWAALEERCRALGLLCRMRDITAAYQRGYGERQLTLFLSCGPSAHLFRRTAVGGAHLPPVACGGPHKGAGGQGHGDRQLGGPSGGDGPGQRPDVPPDQEGERGAQDGLPAADFEACAEGIAVLQAEEAHHVHRDIVLVWLQKAAVDQYADARPVLRPGPLQELQKAQERGGKAVGIEGEDQQQVGAVRRRRRQLGVILCSQGRIAGLPFPAGLKQLGIAPGIGAGGAGAAVYDQKLHHRATSSPTAASSSPSATKRTRWLRKDMLWALRSTSRVNRARSSARSAP